MSPDSIRFLLRMGWKQCGGEYWEHGDFPLEQFHESEAIQIAREQFKKESAKE